MGHIAPARLLLTLYALINIVLCALAIGGIDTLAVIGLIALFFFMSIMFPALFALGVRDLGHHTKRASSFMIMAIVGGAIMPHFMGMIADRSGTTQAYALPLGCFVRVARYDAKQSRQ